MLSTTPALSMYLDMTTGHGPWCPVGFIPTVPTPVGATTPVPTGASPNVIINGRNVHNVGNTTLPHFALLPVPPDLHSDTCLLYTSPSPRDATLSRMPSSA